jgi:hypothetical protein
MLAWATASCMCCLQHQQRSALYVGAPAAGSLPAAYSNWTRPVLFKVSGNLLTGEAARLLNTACTTGAVVCSLTSNPSAQRCTQLSHALQHEQGMSYTASPHPCLPPITTARPRCVTPACACPWTGTLPPAYSSWRWMRTMNMSVNSFVGTVPALYSNQTALTNVDVRSNPGLTGCLPSATWLSAVTAAGGVTNTSLNASVC